MTASSDGSIPHLADGRPIEAVLFDLDGTLVDALSAWDAAFASALAIAVRTYPELAELGGGAAVHRSLFRPLVAAEHRAAGSGHWDPRFLRRAFHALLSTHARSDPALADRLYATYAATWPQHVRPYAEVPAVLEALAGRVQLAIVSNGDGPEQRAKIGPLGLDAHFPVVCISGELGTRKPEPAIFEHALDALSVPPDRAIHVGDDLEADIGGARATGLAASVWVHRDGEGATPVEAHVPENRLASLEPLPALLGF
jgi:putative hydrolase of the HAD superfamily